jgi:transcriptional/translational regulatory protein YebC/TACO1
LHNFPSANIEAAMNKAEQSKQEFEERLFEGQWGNVTLVIQSVTDSRNRTSQTIKFTFSKFGGALTPVMWAFDYKGVITFQFDRTAWNEEV